MLYTYTHRICVCLCTRYIYSHTIYINIYHTLSIHVDDITYIKLITYRDIPDTYRVFKKQSISFNKNNCLKLIIRNDFLRLKRLRQLAHPKSNPQSCRPGDVFTNHRYDIHWHLHDLHICQNFIRKIKTRIK